MSILNSCAAPSDYVDKELGNLITGYGEDSKPTAGFQRVIQRAVIHVQSSGREEVTGANVLVAIFAERESHAAYFLQEQDMTRYDAVNFISHGIAKRPGLSESRPVRGAEEAWSRKRQGRPSGEEGGKKKGDALTASASTSTRRPDRQDRSADRPQEEVNRTIQMLCRRSKNNPLYVGDPGVGKTAIAEGLAKRIVDGEVPEVLKDCGDLSLDMGVAAGRHPLSRRFRGTPQAGGQGTRGSDGRHAVHRRDPHRDRGRRHVRRGDGCLQPAEAGLVVRQQSVASVRPPTRNIASSSKRTARWCAGSRRSMSPSRRCPMRSRS
jgi:hypothetical protein